MARLFDNNAANYMSRSSVNLGLNGATACSFGYWIKITNINTTLQQRILAKEINGKESQNSIWSVIVANATTIQFQVQNSVGILFPDWTLNSGIGTGTWHRLLFAWQRTASAISTDASVYLDGVAVSTTFTANGYSNTFTIEEDTSNLYYGIRAISLTQPLDAALDWVCVWNRQLTAQEVLLDYTNPRNVTNGLVSRVRLGGTDADEAYGGNMAVNGTLRDVSGNVPIRAGAHRSMFQSVNWE